MKFKFSKYLLMVVLLPVVIYAGDSQKARLIDKINGLKNDQGTVKVVFCNSPENYNDNNSPFNAEIIKI
ncbi:MAG: hypothetical protein HZC46_05720 [Ignavibacterium album]|uniref:hypothetical protein n=1 Tax=Ignavibacterium album TaxID=591197 RepID=UPI0026F169FF|nr:hypothetical protein [Ignavibacterium album]MBI5661624.1 hypothetical protein [Ignavibacterium album]